MTKAIGFSRKIKFEWLNQTVNYLNQNNDLKIVKHLISDYLSYEIKSPTNLRKTENIISNIWLKSDENSSKLRELALSLINKYPLYALTVHWCLIITAYPVFIDFCKFIGQLFKFQDTITNAQIRQKMYDEWGERSTLYYSIEKLLSTLKEFGVLNQPKTGCYEISKTSINDNEITNFMLYTYLQTNEKDGIPLNQMQNLSCFFPFEYKISLDSLINTNLFIVAKLGEKTYISLKS